MNHRNALAALVLLAACAGPRAAEPARPADPAAAEAEVRAALTSFFAAAERFDWRAIDGMLAEDFEFYTDDAVVLNRSQFLEAMVGDEMKIHRLDLESPRVTLSGDGSLAWVKYRVSMDASIQEAPYNMVSAETVVYRRDGGAWKMTHNHASIQAEE